MRQIIVKYKITPPVSGYETRIEAPRGFHPLSVHVQRGDIVVWGIVTVVGDEPLPTVPPAIGGPKLAKHAFLVVPTGVEVDISYAPFLGTVLLEDGALVFHIFHVQRSK